MNFSLTDDQKAISDMVRDVARAEKAPAWEQLAELGLCGINVPEALGGAGFGVLDAAMCIAQMSQGFPSVGRMLQVHNLGCVSSLLLAGSDTQKKELLPALASGQLVGAWALEPSQVPQGARVEALVIGSHLYRGTLEATPVGVMGFRGSEPASVVLDESSAEPLPGNISGVHGHAQIGLAAVALGIAKGALKHGAQYAQERKQFGKAISRFQAIKWKIADSAMQTEAAELAVFRAAWQLDQGKGAVKETNMALLLATQAALLTTDHALQIHGGYGYTEEYPVEELYRDARACALVDGGQDMARDRTAASLLASV